MKLTFFTRHTLDIWLMRCRHVPVLDISLSLMSKIPREISQIVSLTSKESNSITQEKGTGKPGSRIYDTLLSRKLYPGTFSPIPDFSELLKTTIRTCRK